MKRSRVLTLFLALLLAGVVPSGASAQEKPRYGGILNWYDYADPGRLDIHTEGPLAVQQAIAGVYSGLLHHDPDDPARISGDLAERWAVSPDGKTYTFNLRNGVKWHDGQPFSAADVKATFDRILHPDFRSPRCGTMLKPIVSSVEVVDSHTVQIRLKFATGAFVPNLASAWCRIVAKHILEKHGNDLSKPEAQIGTGPFKFKKYERGNLIEWEKNKEYFIPGLPYLDGVKQFILPAVQTQLLAAKAGRIMLWDTWPPMSKTQADEVKKARGDEVKIYQAPLNTIFMIFFHTQKTPFNSPDMRRAVNLAIDRQELVAKTLEGAGVPCALLDPQLVGDFALPLEEVNKLPGCRQPKDQDIAEARKLVEKHYPNGVDVEAAFRAVGGYSDRAQIILSQLRKIGIRGTLKPYESAAGFAVFGKGDFTFIVVQDLPMATIDPGDVFNALFMTGGGRNYGKWSDPKVDAWIDQALKAPTREQRRQTYHELQRYLLTQDMSAVTAGWVEGWFFLDKRVRGYKVAPTVYDNNTFMRVWLAQ